MSTHHAHVRWQRTSPDFTYETYNREHTWDLGEAGIVQGSAAPGYKGAASHVDPEQAFVASLSSCHMLTFLAVAAKRRLVVERYEDPAVGFLEKDENGRMAVTRVELHPVVEFAGKTPDAEALRRLHDTAHRHCFIANSVKTAITVV